MSMHENLRGCNFSPMTFVKSKILMQNNGSVCPLLRFGNLFMSMAMDFFYKNKLQLVT